MSEVAKRAPEIYAHIKDLADDGYKDAAQFMDDYIGYWEQLEEAENAYYEKLTSTSFDTLSNDFANALMDMNTSASDFADSFEDYMKQAIINSLVSDTYKPLLETWYKDFGDAMADGIMSEGEALALKRSWDNITAQGLKDRDRLQQIFGWGATDEGSGAYGAAKSFTQEQGDVLNGRLTALQIGQENIRRDVAAGVEALRSVATLGSEMQGIMISNNSYLEDIARYTRITSQLGEKLDRLILNTDKL